MLQRIRHTNILSKFKITSKLLAVKSCAYLSELPGTKFEGSSYSLRCHVWNDKKDFVILIVTFSILVTESYHGIIGKPLVVVLFPMIPKDVLQQKRCLVTPDIFRNGWVGWTENVILMFCMTNWVWTSPLSSNSVSIHQKPLQFVVTKIFKSLSQSRIYVIVLSAEKAILQFKKRTYSKFT